MVSTIFDDYRNGSPRIAAWYAHYLAKGCSTTKADSVARRKVSQSHTWPPGTVAKP